MLCTRWFLPLLIIPVPTAQPYFLVLFLLSLILHARPCFYCISLLTALFMSSCYWQPISITSPLARPWSENITTFSDAWDATVQNFDLSIPKPTVMRLTDRCWVDWSFGGMFKPFNVTEWERVSILKVQLEMVKEEKERLEKTLTSRNTSDALDSSSGHADLHSSSTDATKQNDAAGSDSGSPSPFGTRLRDMFSASIWRRSTSADASSPLGVPLPAGEAASEEAPSTTDTTSAPPELPTLRPSLPWLRREYDLRPYGFDVIFDLGWTP
ncbi:hypothetical protein GLOTRDRAFT_135572 [Gloeophyllum trabeum ATCC 11539]|uniref:Uncharacterized protein n=1 Tax=Gloeophyllum trabeum (strain ATCC 11539 / FP-39264 / Madison 617) TaxID=670483 RepID=S7S0W4_GLOTA|nr:uncharacterized protein GLOTRDRAFT_135572 [Gloeophyllum trabeum ATCC 11539]EPQ60995.1 hypothetical protein GLOTRDRAFT_135572 [Gloeophyllum trabeum ATCC 11539]